jgi:beta-aspartyl-peptidase (threonine type)
MTAAQGAGLRATLQVGYHLLDRESSVLTAMQQTIRVLERSGLFNAGKGSHLQVNVVRRMGASILEGHDLRAEAVDSAEVIVHSITVARLVMEHTSHVFLVGASATTFARDFKLERQPRRPPNRSMRASCMSRALSCKALWLYRNKMKGGRALHERAGNDTVMAVALDRYGAVAADASSGGIDLMLSETNR